MTERRCPDCDKLVAVTTDGFRGSLALYCPRCKLTFGAVGEWPQLRCVCKKWLLSGAVQAGAVNVSCRRCHTLVQLTSTTAVSAYIERPAVRVKRVLSALAPIVTDQQLVAEIEARWAAQRSILAQQRAELAVGLRFDVFNRDGFRCVYCGRSPTEGVLLEADHVVARANGGRDVLANLVTACRDCNRGKSAKPLTAGIEAA